MTHPRIVPKPTASEEYRLDAMKLLKDILAEVEAGEVTGVVVFCKEVGGDWRHSASGTISFAETIGELQILQHNWVRRMLDESKSLPPRAG